MNRNDKTDSILDAVIVGAGLAGLSAAYTLRDEKIVVLEASDRVGGRVHSEGRGNYWLNFGAHMFDGEGTHVGGLVEQLGLSAKPINGELLGMSINRRRILNGAVELYPFRLPLPLAARISFIKMGLALRMGTTATASALKTRAEEDDTQRRHRLQQFRNDRTLSQMVGALHPEIKAILAAITERTGGDPDEMAAGYALRSFVNVWSKGAPGRNLIGGSALLPQAIARALGDKLLLDARVTSVTEKDDHVEIEFTRNGGIDAIRARKCILATQAHVTRQIAATLPAETTAALSQIRYGTFLSVAVLTNESTPMPWDENYAISTPNRSFSVLFNQATTQRTDLIRQAGGSLMLFRGAKGARELLDLNDTQIEQKFLGDLAYEFPESKGNIKDVIVQRWEHGAPYSWPGRAELQSALTRSTNRIKLAGDYLDFPNMEAAVSTGIEAAEWAQKNHS